MLLVGLESFDNLLRMVYIVIATQSYITYVAIATSPIMMTRYLEMVVTTLMACLAIVKIF